MKKIITTAILCTLGLALSAQNLYVQPISGEQVEFAIANQPKITFASRTMTVAPSTGSGAGTSQQFPLGDVQNLSFVKNETDPTSIALTVEDNGIRLYPNPVDDLLTLEIQNPAQGTTYRIFDLNGRLIETGNAPSEQTTINMGGFRQGTYVLTINREGQQIQSFRIVKQ